ncbi:MAG TPA: HAD family phosphatase [Beijerinckiaceae bacterium]
MPQAVVFDIGNVLVRWDMRCLYAKLIDDPRRLDWFLAEVCTLDWHASLDAGATYADAIAALVARWPQEAALIQAYDARWQETISGAIEDNVALLAELRAAGAPVYAITNFPAEKYDETCARFPFLRTFADVVVSGRERVRKPDHAIFRILLDRNGLRAGDCVFIDDMPANVAAARALGFHALRYEPGRDLRPALQELGLPVKVAASGRAS